MVTIFLTESSPSLFLIDQIRSQIELYVTLALAIAGALGAFLLEAKVREKEKKVGHPGYLLAALILQGTSLALGSLAIGSLTSAAADHLSDPKSSIDSVVNDPTLRFLTGGQLVLFVLGVISSGLFLGFNWKRLQEK